MKHKVSYFHSLKRNGLLRHTRLPAQYCFSLTPSGFRLLNTCILILVFITTATSQNYTPIADTSMWVTNGTVRKVIVKNDIAYLMGSFDLVGPNKPYGAVVDTGAGAVVVNFPKPNGRINVSCPDGSGGWYVAGDFTKLGSVKRNGLAHVTSGGLVSSWDPNPDGVIRCIILKDTTVIVAGEFYRIGGTYTGGTPIAVLSQTDGHQLLSFEYVIHTITMSVNSIAAKDNLLYVGGYCDMPWPTPDEYLRVYDLSNGDTVMGYPLPENGRPKSMLFSGDTLFLGGDFTVVDNEFRSYIASINVVTKQLTSLHIVVGGPVSQLAKSGSSLYAVGNFTVANNIDHNGIFAYDLAADSLSPWNPQFNSQPGAIICLNKKIYVGGSYGTGSNYHTYFGYAVDSATAAITSWYPHCSDEIVTISTDGSSIFLGGWFESYGDQVTSQIGLAALYLTGGVVPGWNPVVAGTTNDIAVADSVLYVAGGYSIDSVLIDGLSAVDLNSGELLQNISFVPDNTVRRLFQVGDTLYVSGDFTNIGGQSRNHLASINTNTNTITTWNPNLNDRVADFLKTDNGLFIAGYFLTVGGLSRSYLAKFDNYGNLLNWNPNPNNYVVGITGDDKRVYFSGAFTQVNGISRDNVASVDASTGATTDWFPSSNNNYGFLELLSSGPRVYISGGFDQLGGQIRWEIAAVDTTASNQIATNWNPKMGGGGASGSSLFYYEGRIFVGGSYYNVGNEAHPYFSDFRVDQSNFLSGKIFQDWNANGIQDSLELPIPNCMIQILPDSIFVFTDVDGIYRIYLDSGEHVVTPILPQYYTVALPDSQTIFYSDPFSSATADFGLVPIPVRELESNVVGPKYMMRDHNYIEMVTCINNGTIIDSGMVKFIPDSIPSYLYSFPVADAVVSDTLIWYTHVLHPGESFAATITQYVPYIVPDSTMTSYVQVSPIGGDTIPSNNSDTLLQEIVHPFDPNYKVVDPGDSILILMNQPLKYTVNFQNIGNAPAINVWVTDTLNDDLDVTSFHMLASSHSYQVQIIGRVITWTFAGINLPDSTSNELQSHGFVEYSIKLKQGTNAGTVVTNSASIIFDFNNPIKTNTVSTLFIDSILTPQITYSSALEFCAGDSVILQVDSFPDYLYQWYLNSTEIPGATTSEFIADVSGDYSAKYSSLGFWKNSLPVTVIVNNNPVVSFDSAFSVCTTTPAFHLAGGFPEGGIYEGPGVNFNGDFDPATVGVGEFTIYYYYSDSNGCSGFDSTSIIVDVCFYIDEQEDLGKFLVAPNPTKGIIAIALPSNKPVHIKLYDSRGVKVMEKELLAKNSAVELDFTEFKDGYYLLVVNQENNMGVFKLLIMN
ncbi:MAG TPA: T9SS type A sorting domain-containing protein [Chitinophagales bacterium]|nr:T9SS type A sorting domain-containing protein [Chitinophagales bacterium]